MAGLLTTSGLRVTLGGQPILKGVTLSVDIGWFGVLGVNGSGKTTLLRSLCGRLPADAGRISLDDVDLAGREDLRAQRLLDAPPIDTLPTDLTVSELLALVGESREAPAGSGQQVRSVLRIDEIEHRLIGSLSSGLKQRVAIALAFTGEAQVVLLDEPFNWLDPVTAYELKACLKALAQDRLIVTTLHDVATFTAYCDAGVLLNAGQVARNYDVNELRSRRNDAVAFEAEVYQLLRETALTLGS